MINSLFSFLALVFLTHFLKLNPLISILFLSVIYVPNENYPLGKNHDNQTLTLTQNDKKEKFYLFYFQKEKFS